MRWFVQTRHPYTWDSHSWFPLFWFQNHQDSFCFNLAFHAAWQKGTMVRWGKHAGRLARTPSVTNEWHAIEIGSRKKGINGSMEEKHWGRSSSCKSGWRRSPKRSHQDLGLHLSTPTLCFYLYWLCLRELYPCCKNVLWQQQLTSCQLAHHLSW